MHTNNRSRLYDGNQVKISFNKKKQKDNNILQLYRK